MRESVFIALINPGMSLVFAATFFLLWRYRPQERYVLLLSLSLLAVSAGFLLQYFVLYSDIVSRLLSNLLLLVGAAGFFIGSLGRFRRRPPVRATIWITAAGAVLFLWFLYVDHDITMRIYVINFTIGAVMLVVAREIGKARDRSFVDNLMLGQLIFWGVVFYLRPIVVVWLEGPYADYAALEDSLYWMTLTFSASLFLMIFPLTQITAIAIGLMDELRRESQTDSLSGLLNRRGFEEGAERALHSAGRRTLPAALVVCDLDHFKAINDTHGHGCGDEVIVAFAECLRTRVHDGHVVGRIGGEEFAVLLSGTTAGAARLFAEGARMAFGGLDLDCLPPGTRLSASFGVAERQGEESLAGLFSRADAALYEAKKTGRDRVRVASLRYVESDKRAPAAG